jgi:hypothetical protein
MALISLKDRMRRSMGQDAAGFRATIDRQARGVPADEHSVTRVFALTGPL